MPTKNKYVEFSQIVYDSENFTGYQVVTIREKIEQVKDTQVQNEATGSKTR